MSTAIDIITDSKFINDKNNSYWSSKKDEKCLNVFLIKIYILNTTMFSIILI